MIFITLWRIPFKYFGWHPLYIQRAKQVCGTNLFWVDICFKSKNSWVYTFSGDQHFHVLLSTQLCLHFWHLCMKLCWVLYLVVKHQMRDLALFVSDKYFVFLILLYIQPREKKLLLLNFPNEYFSLSFDITSVSKLSDPAVMKSSTCINKSTFSWPFLWK